MDYNFCGCGKGGIGMQSPNIKEAKALDGYKLLIKFANDEEKVFDMKPYLYYPVFQPLNDLKEFNNFFIGDGTIEWNCGADLSQETFYIESTLVNNTNSALSN
jgi:hypothetical protein